MPEKTDAFRANVRRFTKLRGMTYGELAVRATLSREWLSKMLAGRSNPTLPVCERIAIALGTSIEALVAADPTPPQKKVSEFCQTGIDEP
ncbi:MAG TPA: helix-turn-helix transcriptional regulator [Thermoguttaceae bacterium]|nr:helix-turn-helix transcriptional regulator [Thermoguttaceae bacterium]